jgi:hypothetical protein
MPMKIDLMAEACLQLARSTDTMRAAAKTYLRLAEETPCGHDRTAFLECAAFYAQLADSSRVRNEVPLNGGIWLETDGDDDGPD